MNIFHQHGKYPGFFGRLQKSIEEAGPDCIERINRTGGFHVVDFLNHLLNPVDHNILNAEDINEGIVTDYSEECISIGQDAIKEGKVALFVDTCGENSTKSGLSRIPGIGMSLLGFRILQSVDVKDKWIICDEDNRSEIDTHVSCLTNSQIELINHFDTIKLSPDYQVVTKNDKIHLAPCGSGDLLELVRTSSEINRFLDRGGKYIFYSHVSNLMGHLDAAILGHHIKSGLPVTCEIVRSKQNESGDFVCNYNGFDQVVGDFRIINPHELTHISTGNFIINADIDSSIQLPWHRTKRIDKKGVYIVYQRFLSDLTSKLKTQFIRVDREKRFIQVSSEEELSSMSSTHFGCT